MSRRIELKVANSLPTDKRKKKVLKANTATATKKSYNIPFDRLLKNVKEVADPHLTYKDKSRLCDGKFHIFGAQTRLGKSHLQA